MDILQTITELSHEFGTPTFVRGGGGNTSCKDERTLWVKPSGTTLAGLCIESFIAIDRQKLSELYTVEPPADSSGREALVKRMMEQAVLPQTPGRASVEAPLHDSLKARYVVHTHPALVNGMTCSKNGKAAAQELFPDALWLDYIDPGYTLCMQVRKEIQAYEQRHGRQPEVIFLKNHGVFVAADTADAIRASYAAILSKLQSRYGRDGISAEIPMTPGPSEKVIGIAKQTIREAMRKPDMFISVAGYFEVTAGPVSPDHIVYSKSYPFIGEPSMDLIEAFKTKHGYLPHVLVFDAAIFGVADTAKGAALALELAQDGALVRHLAQAFGGIDYMTDRARKFIENWEVEAYRQKQMKD